MASKNNFLKELGRKEVVVPHLNRWFRNKDFPEKIDFSIHLHKEEDTAFHPSGATGCARELYAVRVGDIIRKPESNSYKAFFFGHYFHALIQHILVDELEMVDPTDVEKEFRIYRREDSIYRPQEWWIDTHLTADALWWGRGYADIAKIQPPGHDKPYLVDIKTMNANDYRKESLPPHVEEKYVTQINLYMDWEDIEDGIILCAQKDSPHGFKEIPIKRNRNLVNSVYTKWDTVAKAVLNGIPPECDCEDASKCPTKELYY